jgi:hypothetical protein
MHDERPASFTELSGALAGCRFNFGDEADLQLAIAEALTIAGLSFERERPLGCDRVDFYLGGLAVEVKVSGALAAVTRQLHRYAQNRDVNRLVLITTKARHKAIPSALSGKPVHVIHLLEGSL